MNLSIPSGKEWRKTLLEVNSSLQQAIGSLNDSSAQIVLVVSADGILQGALTDGDIRRGLLRGLNLGSPIDSLINRDPLVVPPQLGRESVLQLMQANRIHQLPVVDEKRRVVGLTT
jgi:CBS domain-containing protein